MILRHPRTTLTDTYLPYTTLFRSPQGAAQLHAPFRHAPDHRPALRLEERGRRISDLGALRRGTRLSSDDRAARDGRRTAARGDGAVHRIRADQFDELDGQHADRQDRKSTRLNYSH